jgi:hypothetical protein
MQPRSRLPAALLAIFGAALVAASPAHALDGCHVGEICELTFPLFGCKDATRLKRWVDLYVDDSRDAAEAYLDAEEAAGRCLRFNKGDRLRIVRYIGLSRLEAARPGETQIYTVLLK